MPPRAVVVTTLLLALAGCAHLASRDEPGPSRAALALTEFDSRVAEMRAWFARIDGTPDDWLWVRAKLDHMVELDQFVRKFADHPFAAGFAEQELEEFQNGLAPRWREIDERNTRDLKELLEIHGWFTISAFGPEADRNAWLLVQHADLDVAFQKEVLAILGSLLEQGETSRGNYAYLYDRVAVAEGRPQRYGTQGRCVGEGLWEPYPIEGEHAVDERRADMGLGTLAEYRALFVDVCR